MTTLLSVNLNKIAVLRNSRGGAEPALAPAVETVIAAGAAGITVHPRPDRRHILPEDVAGLVRVIANRVELNIEGNPFAGPGPGYPGFLELVCQSCPDQATLVPDSDGQITSDHGFDLLRDTARLAPIVERLKRLGCRVSLFVDAGCPGLELAAAIGVDRVELYTGPFALAHAAGDADVELSALRDTALEALGLGMAVNAGHDLSQANLADFLSHVPEVSEVSIGHALIAESLYAGLAETVRRYVSIVSSQAGRRM